MFKDLVPSIRNLFSPLPPSACPAVKSDEKLLLSIPTKQLVDAGYWVRKAAATLHLTNERLILRADGPAPFEHSWNLNNISHAQYSPMNQSLLLCLKPNRQAYTIRMGPVEAREIINLLSSIQPKEPEYV